MSGLVLHAIFLLVAVLAQALLQVLFVVDVPLGPDHFSLSINSVINTQGTNQLA